MQRGRARSIWFVWLVWGQLNQVAGDKPGRDAEAAEGLHQQPGGVAAGAGAQLQGVLGSLHAVVEAGDVADCVAHTAIEIGKERDGSATLARDAGDKRL